MVGYLKNDTYCSSSCNFRIKQPRKRSSTHGAALIDDEQPKTTLMEAAEALGRSVAPGLEEFEMSLFEFAKKAPRDRGGNK